MNKKVYQICGLAVEIRKDFYNGLWYIRYVDGGEIYAGPWKTKREAKQRLLEITEN